MQFINEDSSNNDFTLIRLIFIFYLSYFDKYKIGKRITKPAIPQYFWITSSRGFGSCVLSLNSMIRSLMDHCLTIRIWPKHVTRDYVSPSLYNIYLTWNPLLATCLLSAAKSKLIIVFRNLNSWSCSFLDYSVENLLHCYVFRKREKILQTVFIFIHSVHSLFL